ncbi:MAG: glycogen synthase [Clostridia bacterium]|nr:glycogen synthase [Clostridia bacterium]
MESNLKVLFVAAECTPYIKVGGLGDVAGELPLKLKELGVDVNIVIPANKDMEVPTQYKGDFPVNLGWRNETCVVREVINAPVPTYLVDNYHYFGRSGVYGHRDDPERFAFFCMAVYEMLQHFDYKPDVIHLNDWHTAPLAMLIRENEREHPHFHEIALLYTIHNLEYQGVSGRNIFAMFGVKDVVFKTTKVEYYGCFNAMKAGLNYADIITGVSKTFSHQMLSPEHGFGLEGVVQSRKSALRGVINGINTSLWNPETDALLVNTYNSEGLLKKRENKRQLKKDLGLDEKDVPLFASVTRLVPNKGLDLLEGAAEYIVKEGGQFILLGSGEKYYENVFMRLMDRYPGSISVNLEFNNAKAHRIYSGSDFFLMPSRYEPCGISQLIAMRYGTIPIVHKTGGLADTVLDAGKNTGEGTGFTFATYSMDAFQRALKKAFGIYKDESALSGLIKRAMSRESSWEEPAREYLSLYEEARKENQKRKTKGRKTLFEEKGKGESHI